MADVIMLAERPSNVSARSVPAAPSAASFADSAVSDAAPQAIGNYKGVMLCNRPGVIADTPDWLKPAGNELPVFRAGVPHEVVHPRGRDTLFDRPPVKIPPRKKRHDAMEAHRSWLTSLIQRRAALQAERDSEELRKTEVHKHVAERQQAFRDLVRSQAPFGDTASAAMADAAAASAAPSDDEGRKDAKAGARAPAPSTARQPPPPAAAAATARARPAWARSAAVQDAVEEDEARELLEFAGSLDYDRYEADLEGGAASRLLDKKLAAVDAASAEATKQLRAMEAEEESDRRRRRRERRRRRLLRRARAAKAGAAGDGGEGGDAAAATAGRSSSSAKENTAAGEAGRDASDDDGKRASDSDGGSGSGGSSSDSASSDSDVSSVGPLPGAEGLRGAHGGGRRRRANGSVSSSVAFGGGAAGGGGGDDAASLASSIFSSSSSSGLKAIHSKRSLTAVIERQVAATAEHAAATLAGCPGGFVPGEGVPEPRIVVHAEGAEGFAVKKALVGLLPYQHRHPGV